MWHLRLARSTTLVLTAIVACPVPVSAQEIPPPPNVGDLCYPKHVNDELRWQTYYPDLPCKSFSHDEATNRDVGWYCSEDYDPASHRGRPKFTVACRDAITEKQKSEGPEFRWPDYYNRSYSDRPAIGEECFPLDDHRCAKIDPSLQGPDAWKSGAHVTCKMGPDDMPVWQPYTSESVTCVGSVKADDENRAWTCEEKEGPTSTPSEPVFMARCRDSKTATTDWFVSDRVQPLIGDPCQAQGAYRCSKENHTEWKSLSALVECKMTDGKLQWQPYDPNHPCKGYTLEPVEEVIGECREHYIVESHPGRPKFQVQCWDPETDKKSGWAMNWPKYYDQPYGDRPVIGDECFPVGNHRCAKDDPSLQGENAWKSGAHVTCKMGLDKRAVWQPAANVTCSGLSNASNETVPWTCEEQEGKMSTPAKPVFMARCVDNGVNMTEWYGQSGSAFNSIG